MRKQNENNQKTIKRKQKRQENTKTNIRQHQQKKENNMKTQTTTKAIIKR